MYTYDQKCVSCPIIQGMMALVRLKDGEMTIDNCRLRDAYINKQVVCLKHELYMGTH